MSDDVAIGIDLGTSNSCVSWSEGENVDVLANAFGENVTASVVAFGEDGAITVGNAAKANIIHDPRHTVYSAKRLIGRYYFSDEVKKAQAVSSYRIVEGPSHGIRIQIRKEQFSLPEISAMVLREMKGIAEDRLGRPVKQAVITVPAYFNDNQRQATRDAGRIAGLEVLRLLNEPTAAALAYGFGRGLNQRVAVYDLGGGTFDISILEIGRDVFEVLSTCGDTYLGGDDFDDRLIDLVADEFLATQGLNLRSDPYALEKLKVAAENAKKGLSVDDEVEINIPDIMTAEDGSGRSIQRTIATAEYTSLVMDLIQRTFKVCDEALQQANMIARDLDGVILVGGPTRLPLIRSAVSDYFQQEAQTDVDPDEVVAMGAAIHAASLTAPTQESYLLDVTPLSLRIGVAGGLAEAVIDRNTPVPIEQTRAFTTVQDAQERVQIRVYQGESRQAEENELLGQFEFSGFEKKARGEVTIDVTFEINGDGIVSVLAEDRETGRQASTEITFSSGLTNTEIEKIIEDGATDRVQTNGSEAPQSAAAPAAAAPAAVDPSEDLAILAEDDDDGDLFGDEPPSATAEATSRPVHDDVDVLLTDDGDDHDLELDSSEENEPEMVIERPQTLEAAAEPAAPPPSPAPQAIEPASEVNLEAAGLDDAVAGEVELTPEDLEGLEEIELGSEDQLDDLDADADAERIGGAPEFAPEDFEEDENASTQPELEVEVAAAAPAAADAQPDADGAPEKAKPGLFGDVGTDLSEL